MRHSISRPGDTTPGGILIGVDGTGRRAECFTGVKFSFKRFGTARRARPRQLLCGAESADVDFMTSSTNVDFMTSGEDM